MSRFDLGGLSRIGLLAAARTRYYAVEVASTPGGDRRMAIAIVGMLDEREEALRMIRDRIGREDTPPA